MEPGSARILVIDDNPADVYLIREAIAHTGLKRPLIEILTDGEEATELFDEADRNESVGCPTLVILDINLPKKRGFEVLMHLRRSRRCNHVPVIVVSTSGASKDRDTMMQGGANAYFRKPSEFDEFLKLGDLVVEWLSKETLN